MQNKLVTKIGILCFTAVFMSACNASESAPDPPSQDAFEPGIHRDEPTTTPTHGGTLSIADPVEVATLNPVTEIVTGATGGRSFAAVYDQLVRYDFESEAYVPQLAESVTPNEDFTQWTIRLREGVNFSDGTPMDAESVKSSMEYYVDNSGYDMQVIGPLWRGVEVLDKRTVVISLQESWASFDAMLGTGLGFIVAPAAIAGGPDNFKPIGAGPFTFVRHTPQEELLLAANPSYWDGEPYLEQLRFVWLGGDDVKAEALRTDSVNATIITDPRRVKELREDGFPGFLTIYNQGAHLMVNQAPGRIGEDPRVREAISHSIDPEAVSNRVYDGIGLPTKKLFGETSRWANDIEPSPFDPELAAGLVGDLEDSGVNLELNYVARSEPVFRDEALTFQGQLEAVGFHIQQDLVRTPADLVRRVYVEADYDLTRTATNIPDEHPYQRLYTYMHSDSPGNVSGYSSPAMDELIEELRGLPLDEMGPVLSRIEEQYQKDVPLVTFSAAPWFHVWQENVHGVLPGGDMIATYAKAWIE